VVYAPYGEQPVRLWGIDGHHRPAARRSDHEGRRGIFLWSIVVYFFFKALRRRLQANEHQYRAAPMPTSEITVTGHDEVPLTTADVEREFARIPARPTLERYGLEPSTACPR
jgi:hypothetical protein